METIRETQQAIKLLLMFSLLLCLLYSSTVFAACSGLPVESTTGKWTAYDASYDCVSEAVSKANPGDTVIIPTGSETWASTLTISKSIILTGSGNLGTTINGSGETLINVDLPADVVLRIHNIHFKWSTNNPGGRSIHISGKTNNSFAYTKIRIDNNKFEKGSRALQSNGWVYGLIDNNTFVNCNIAVGITGDNNHAWGRSIGAGTADALFIEDNTLIINNDADRGPNEQIYHQEGSRTVIRYNAFEGEDYTDGAYLAFDSHGNQSYYDGTGDFRGQPLIEFYSNTIDIDSTYRHFNFRSGSLLIYDNDITQTKSTSPNKFYLQDEEAWQTQFFSTLRTEWPAQDQVNNSFFWNNTFNGSPITSANVPSNSLDFIEEDRDYFMHAPQAAGGKSTYTGRAGADMTFSSSGPNAYYPYTPYEYPHPLTKDSEDPVNPVNTGIKIKI